MALVAGAPGAQPLHLAPAVGPARVVVAGVEVAPGVGVAGVSLDADALLAAGARVLVAAGVGAAGAQQAGIHATLGEAVALVTGAGRKLEAGKISSGNTISN